MIEIILIFILILFVALPIIYFVYSYQSKYYSCPFCGNRILKSDNICKYCSENLGKLDTPDKKIITIGKSFREGAEIRTKGEGDIEKIYKEGKLKK